MTFLLPNTPRSASLWRVYQRITRLNRRYYGCGDGARQVRDVFIPDNSVLSNRQPAASSAWRVLCCCPSPLPYKMPRIHPRCRAACRSRQRLFLPPLLAYRPLLAFATLARLAPPSGSPAGVVADSKRWRAQQPLGAFAYRALPAACHLLHLLPRACLAGTGLTMPFSPI